MEEGFKCFDTAKTSVFGLRSQNASRTAELVFNISKQAKEVQTSSKFFFYTILSPPLVCKLFLKHFSSLIH